MNKRDTIIVAFRVLAIFVAINLIANMPSILFIWTGQQRYIFPLYDLIIRTVLLILVPSVGVYLLWKRSTWVADKILAPIGMDELWEDQNDIELSPEGPKDLPEDKMIPEATITHLNRDEIETIALTVLAVWVLTRSVPDLLRFIASILANNNFNTDSVISLGVVPEAKTLIAVLLLLRSGHLVAWVSRWRELRMKD